MGIIGRLGSLANSDAGQAFGTAHDHFQHRLNTHGHFGRALIESIAETCRNHPNFAGIAVGVLVEQLLVHEKHHHEAEIARNGGVPPPSGGPPALPRAAAPHTPHHMIRLSGLRPGHLALEVFGALVLLKFGVGIARTFSRKHKKPSLAPLARIHLFSATFGTYFTAKALKSHEVSAWRNAAAMLFVTDALKPLLTPDYSRPPPAPRHVSPPVAAPPPAPPTENGHAPVEAMPPTAPPEEGDALTLH